MTTDRRSFGVMLAGAAAFFDLYAPQSILPQLAAEFGVSGHQAGWVITVTTLAVALIGPFAGALADAFGRKRLIAAGALARSSRRSWPRRPRRLASC
jgi:MFS transporter, YNFM family, putative membrane transport protein